MDRSKLGKNAARTGADWEREWIRDFHTATGVKLDRQLKERREGNLGDIEIHADVPCVFQCRKRKDVSLFSALADAQEAAEYHQVHGHYPVAVLQKRTGSTGHANPRAVGMFEEDWLDLLETFLADEANGIPSWVAERRTGSKYPRVWDALEDAKETAKRTFGKLPCVPVGLGIIETPGEKNVVLVDYDGWLRVVGELFRRKLW